MMSMESGNLYIPGIRHPEGKPVSKLPDESSKGCYNR